jgi:hypothetical protein
MTPTLPLRASVLTKSLFAITSLLTIYSLRSGYSSTTDTTRGLEFDITNLAVLSSTETHSATHETGTEAVLKQIPAQNEKTAAKTQVKEVARKNEETNSTTSKNTTKVVLKQIPAQKEKTAAKTQVKEVARKNETNSTTSKKIT